MSRLEREARSGSVADRGERRDAGSAAAVGGPAGRLGAALLGGAVLLAGSGAWAVPAPAAAQDLAVVGAEVRPVSGPAMSDATVLVRDGVIEAVGPDVRVPDGVRTLDGSGMVVTPGLFDANTRVGLVEVGAVEETRDFAMEAEDPVKAAFHVADGLNPNSTLVPVTRLGGVTTVVSNPGGGLVAGQSAVVDLAGATVDEMLVAGRASMVASYGAGVTGGSRGAAALRLREALDEARYYAANRRGYDRGNARPLGQSRLDLEALQAVLSGDRPLVVNADRASDLLAAVGIAEEYGLDLVLQGGAEAWMVAGRLAEAGVPVILKPLTNSPEDFDLLGARFDNAALLHRAGVTVVLSTFDAHNARGLRFEAGNAVRFGMPDDAALRAVTLTPAEVFGVADTHGSLEPGKAGNLVLWTGDPFELSSRPEAVVIRGRVVPEDSRQEELFRRYRELGRDLPPAYREGRGAAGSP